MKWPSTKSRKTRLKPNIYDPRYLYYSYLDGKKESLRQIFPSGYFARRLKI